MSTQRLPLNGFKVLDLTAHRAGPTAVRQLADWGADVIKIEPPGGDNLRQYPSTLQSENRAFLGVNRSKQGVVLDLKNPEALAVLLRLVELADVLVHNFRPGVPERLGIDYERLARLNPRLIYCAVTGYGETGPLKGSAERSHERRRLRQLAILHLDRALPCACRADIDAVARLADCGARRGAEARIIGDPPDQRVRVEQQLHVRSGGRTGPSSHSAISSSVIGAKASSRVAPRTS